MKTAVISESDPDWSDLTAFQRDTLVAIADIEREKTNEPPYGLAIKRRLEEMYGDDINHGRLYPNLDQLAKVGLIDKSELDQRKNGYALAPESTAILTNQHEALGEVLGE